MARPQKSGLDYFPLNVDIDTDDKISLIESEHGLDGFGMIIKILCKIYQNSYFYEWGEKEQLLFSKRVNVDINKVNDCIKSALKWDLFDETVYKKYGVLTSGGIQKRYLEAISRRKSIEIIQNYWLIDIPQLDKTDVKVINVDTNEVNVIINSTNVNISTQSKEKKSKEKKSKVNNIDKDIYYYKEIKELVNSGYITENDDQIDDYISFISMLYMDYRPNEIDRVFSYFITHKPDIVHDKFNYFQVSINDGLDRITSRKLKKNANEGLLMFKNFLEA